MNHRQGFTLIELSIVLLVIGLIVGGILTGSEMIDQARVRAQISQLEKYKTSINAFREKYRYLPGDLPEDIAHQLDFFAADGGWQNGNGIIDGLEVYIFWRHLTDAHMIDGNFGTDSSGSPLSSSGDVPGLLNAGQVNQVVPPAKIGLGNYLLLSQSRTPNSLRLIRVDSLDTDSTTGISSRDGLTPLQAYEIDRKMDDGISSSGKVWVEMFSPCRTGAYDITPPTGNTVICTLDIGF